MSKTSPLVSIIIPVYNHEEYIVQALTSVLEQSYPNIEMIVIDDGSKDRSPIIIEELIQKWNLNKRSGRKATFIKQANQGAHNAINKGLSLATGQFLTILNSDDYYASNRIEILIKALEKQKAEWGFTGVHGIDRNEKDLPLDHYWKVWYETNVFNSCLQPTIGFQLLKDNMAVSSGNLFFSRYIYEKVGHFKPLKLAHDLDFILRALLIAEPVFIYEKLYFYRMHATNTLHSVGHLLEHEKKAIYLDYLEQINKGPPLNKSAPCHWYWPIAFPKFRTDLCMDRGFLADLVNTETFSKPTSKNEQNYESSVSIKKGKITLITHTLCLSGAPKVVLDFARILKKRGYSLNLISLLDGPLKKEFKALNIDVYVIPEHLKYWLEPSKKKKIFKLIRLIPRLLLKSSKTVISNCAVSWPILFPLVLTAPFKKFFWYIHDSFSPSCMITPGVSMRALEKVSKKKNLKTWFGSDSTRKIWNEGIKGEVKYWSGISQQSSPRIRKDKIRKILSIGTVNTRKSPHYLIDAFIQCIEENHIPEDVTLTLIGFTESQTDPYLYELLNKRNQLKIKERITFVKNLEAEQLQSFYDEADLYIQSSVVECLPLSLLQAMAKGLPIITTDVNGCTEAIIHQETGYVCESRSSSALAGAIVYAISKPDFSFKLGAQAYEKFNEEFCVEQTQDKIFSAL